MKIFIKVGGIKYFQLSIKPGFFLLIQFRVIDKNSTHFTPWNREVKFF